MVNLLKETIGVLNENGKNPANVLWVGDTTLHFSWKDFEKMADREYDGGFGGAEVLRKLLIVGDDWWLERHEYDGSEWWEYKSLPVKPSKEFVMPSVFKNYYEDLDIYDYVWDTDTFQEILDKEQIK